MKRGRGRGYSNSGMMNDPLVKLERELELLKCKRQIIEEQRLIIEKQKLNDRMQRPNSSPWGDHSTQFDVDFDQSCQPYIQSFEPPHQSYNQFADLYESMKDQGQKNVFGRKRGKRPAKDQPIWSAKRQFREPSNSGPPQGRASYGGSPQGGPSHSGPPQGGPSRGGPSPGGPPTARPLMKIRNETQVSNTLPRHVDQFSPAQVRENLGVNKITKPNPQPNPPRKFPPHAPSKKSVISEVLRTDQPPSKQVIGRLELALGQILKTLRTQYSATEQDTTFNSLNVKLIKEELRTRIHTVMLGKVVVDCNSTIAEYRKLYPVETDADILKSATQTKEKIRKDNLATRRNRSVPMEKYIKRNIHQTLDEKLDEMFKKLQELYKQDSNKSLEELIGPEPEDEKNVQEPEKAEAENIGDKKLVAEAKDVEITENMEVVANDNEAEETETEKKKDETEKVHIDKDEDENEIIKKSIRFSYYHRLLDVMILHKLPVILPKFKDLIKDILHSKVVFDKGVASDRRYVKIYGLPNLPPKSEMQEFLKQFNPLSIKKHNKVSKLLFVAVERKDMDAILAANETVIGDCKLLIKMSRNRQDIWFENMRKNKEQSSSSIVEDKTGAIDDNSLSNEQKTGATDDNSASNEQKTGTSDGNSASNEQKTGTTDDNSASNKQETEAYPIDSDLDKDITDLLTSIKNSEGPVEAVEAINTEKENSQMDNGVAETVPMDTAAKDDGKVSEEQEKVTPATEAGASVVVPSVRTRSASRLAQTK